MVFRNSVLLVGWLRSRGMSGVHGGVHVLLRSVHAGGAHLGSSGTHLAAGSSAGTHIVSALFLNSLKVLLVLNLLLDVLVAL